MQAEEFADHGRWELAGVFEQGAVAVGAGVDAYRGEAAGQARVVKGSVWLLAGKQPWGLVELAGDAAGRPEGKLVDQVI
ncbi:hypothetical protein [Actinomadura mexicana]|uniref:hypothetical protein n=1 Tax=Actinomadura mexicana TaxID=134959 RepID=UPI00117866D1|nr:hypothetical protein [Actinomadura mexicana]